MIMDAGGTSYRFFTMRGGEIIVEQDPVLIDGGDLDGCLKAIVEGFNQVPDSDKQVHYDPVQRTGVGLSRLGTSKAISVGAYAYAINKLNSDK